MANSEIRTTKHQCPKCGEQLKQNWLEKQVSLQGLKDWVPAGKPYCPKGHRLEFNLAGQPFG